MAKAKVRASAGLELLLCAPGAADRLLSGFQRWVANPELFETFNQPQVIDRMRGQETSPRWGAYRIDNGAALIPISGMLIPSGQFLGSIFGMTSQEGLRSELTRALNDDDVERVILMIDSPGGFASGSDTTAALIRKVNETKPVIASISGLAASGAYWLASQASKIVSGPIAEIGSIGVLIAHMDISAVFQAMGIKVTLIHAGTKKVDGNPYEALTERVKADMQARVEELRLAFAKEVVLGRKGMISLDAVLNTEGATFMAAEAMAMGLSDEVTHLDAVIGTPSAPEDDEDDEDDTGADVISDIIDNLNEDDEEVQTPAVSPLTTDVEHAITLQDARAEGRAAEKARIKSILTHPLAKGREELARRMAFTTSLPLSLVIMALESAAVTGEAPRTSPTLHEEMRSFKRPMLGADPGPAPESLSQFQLGELAARQLLGKITRS